MKTNRFTTLLASFSDQEKKRFASFLASPYFNSNQTLVELFGRIKDQKVEEIEKPELWKWLFPEREFADNYLRKLFSDLNKLALKFLAAEHLEGDPQWRSFHMLKGGRNDEVKNQVVKVWENAYKRKSAKTAGVASSQNHFFEYQYFLEQYYQDIRVRKDTSHFQSAMTQLDTFYLVERLKGLCERENFKRILNDESFSTMDDYVLEMAEKRTFQALPLVRIYLSVYRFSKTMGNSDAFDRGSMESSYDDLWAMILNAQWTSPSQELATLLNYLQNFCLHFISRGFPQFLNRLDDLFEFRISTGEILSDHIIIPEDYKNRITLLLKLERIQEARSFLDKYKPRLSQDHRKPAYLFSLGNIYFHEKKFEEMRKALCQVGEREPFYFVDCKVLIIKSYLWEGDLNALEFDLDSLTKYLKRSTKLSHERKNPYRIRLKYFKKLFRLMAHSEPSRKRREALRMEINESCPLTDRNFLLEILDRKAIA